MDKEEIVERLEKLEKKNQKIEEENKRIKQENKQIKRKLSQEKTAKNTDNKEKISRRSFLKKLGAGAVGLGALSLSPAASQLKLTKNGIQNARSISTEQVFVTNQTLVVAQLTSDVTVSSGERIAIPYDNIQKDERGEYSTSSNEFVPDETGWYLVTASVAFNSSDSDRIDIFLKDKTNNNILRREFDETGGSSVNSVSITALVELSAGTSYEIIASNSDNSDTIRGDSPKTRLGIRRILR